MRCRSVIQALPGYVGRDLLPATMSAVEAHLATCASCRMARQGHERVSAGMALLAKRDLEPPAMLAEAIIERVDAPRVRRLLPVPPLPPNELVRVINDNRDAIASAAGAAVVVAGAAWVLWRATERRRSVVLELE